MSDNVQPNDPAHGGGSSGLAGAIRGNTGGGLQSSPNVPAPGTSINPATGKPNTAGLTRAELQAKRDAEAERQKAQQADKSIASATDALGPSESRTSFSDDIGKAFDDIGMDNSRREEPVAAAAASASGSGAGTGVASGASASTSTKIAQPAASLEAGHGLSRAVASESGLQGGASGGPTSAPPLESASVLPPAEVQAVSLDGSTTVYFIDDGQEMPKVLEESVTSTQDEDFVPVNGVDEKPSADADGHQVNGAAVGAAGAGLGAGALAATSRGGVDDTPAESHDLNGTSQPLSSSTPATPAPLHDSTPPVPSVYVEPAAESTPGQSDDPSRGSAVLGGAALGAGAGAGAAALGAHLTSPGALSETSDTRLGAQRAASSASITAIHGGSEGKPVHHDGVAPPPQDSATSSKPDSLATSKAGSLNPSSKPESLNLADLPPPPRFDDGDYPLGSPDLPVSSSASLGLGETKRGFDPASSTASITAIRAGQEGNTPNGGVGTGPGTGLGTGKSPLSQTVTAGDDGEDGEAGESEAGAVPERGDESGHDGVGAGVVGAGAGAAGAGAAAAAGTSSRQSDGFHTPVSHLSGRETPVALQSEKDVPPSTTASSTPPSTANPVAGEKSSPQATGDAAPTTTTSERPTSSAPTADTETAPLIPDTSKEAAKPTASSTTPAPTTGATGATGARASTSTAPSNGPAKGHTRNVSTSSSARRRKVGLLARLKGEMKVLSGKMSHDDKKVAEGERLKHGE